MSKLRTVLTTSFLLLGIVFVSSRQDTVTTFCFINESNMRISKISLSLSAKTIYITNLMPTEHRTVQITSKTEESPNIKVEWPSGKFLQKKNILYIDQASQRPNVRIQNGTIEVQTDGSRII